MAIKINNTTIVNNTRNAINIESITFSDGSTQNTAFPNNFTIGDIVTVTGTKIRTLNNPNFYSTFDNYGNSVAIDGNYAIVGADQTDDALGVFSGKAYIFNVTTGALVHTLNNPNYYGTSANDRFGVSVSISGSYAIVGTPYEDDSLFIGESGKAYIFNVTTGALVHALNNPNYYGTGLTDNFGYSVAISGNYAIVGAYLEDDGPTGSGSGKAYIFNVTTGALVHALSNPNYYGTSADDYFGYSVAIDGNYAIVGARLEDDAAGSSSGKAYIFNVTTGALVHALSNPNYYGTGTGDIFGESVAISGNYAIVGAYADNDATGTLSGKAYIFNVTTGALVHALSNPNYYGTSSSDFFGDAVAISGNYAIVGAYGEDDAAGSSSGKAYIFNVTTGALVYGLNNPNEEPPAGNDWFGRAVAISENYAMVAASEDGTGKVHIYNVSNTYRLSNTMYIESATGSIISSDNQIFNIATLGGALVHALSNPNYYGTSADDYFGYLVAISGNYAIVGAYGEDDATGFNSGKAYIYNVTTGALMHVLNNPNYYGTSLNDYFGSAAAIDGNYAIVGAFGEDDATGVNSGKAYIYNVTTGALVHVLNNPNYYGTGSNDYFGYPVAIDGNYAIVGAYLEDDVSGVESGKAYIFNVTTGALVHALSNPNYYGTGLADYFGYSVAISGNYAIVGASQEDDGPTGSASGKAYIYNVTTGALVHALSNPNYFSTGASDNFGDAVAISGNYAIVSASFEDDATGSNSGKVYIFNVTTGALVHALSNPTVYGTGDGDRFGVSVSISGNYAIVGAYVEDDGPTGANSGKAYIFNVTTGALVHVLSNPNYYGTGDGNQFGISVTMSGNYAIVGANQEDDGPTGNNSGKAYIFSVKDQYYFDKLESFARSLI